jgi:hypothetical protein
MSVVYLLLGGDDSSIISGIITSDDYHVFSVYDFMQKVMLGNKSRKYVTNLWETLSRYPQFMEVQGTLGLAVPSTKMPKTKPTSDMTIVGLRAVLDVLGNSVSENCRKTVEDIFARYMAGDSSMLVFVNLDNKEHPQIPRFSYNFQPPAV